MLLLSAYWPSFLTVWDLIQLKSSHLMLVRRRTRNFLLVKRSSNLHPEGLQLLGELFGFNLRITLKFFTFLRSLFSSLNRSSLPSFLPQSVIMQEVELCAMPEHNIYSLFLNFCRVYIIIFILIFSFKLSAQTSLTHIYVRVQFLSCRD